MACRIEDRQKGRARIVPTRTIGGAVRRGLEDWTRSVLIDAWEAWEAWNRPPAPKMRKLVWLDSRTYRLRTSAKCSTAAFPSN